MEHTISFENLFICGDFNCCLLDSDRNKISHMKDSSRETLNHILENLQQKDCYELCDKTPVYTFYDKRCDTASHLDYIFCNVNNCAVTCCSTISSIRTDQKAVTITVRLPLNERGPNYWKLNAKLLENEDYIKGIVKLIEDIVKNKEIKSYILTWEVTKISIKEFSINFSRNIDKQNDCLTLQKEIDKCNDSAEKEKLQNLLDTAYKRKTQGALIRSKIKWYEEGERSTHYFLRQEKQ